jgi:hypothetical protein
MKVLVPVSTMLKYAFFLAIVAAMAGFAARDLSGPSVRPAQVSTVDHSKVIRTEPGKRTVGTSASLVRGHRIEPAELICATTCSPHSHRYVPGVSHSNRLFLFPPIHTNRSPTHRWNMRSGPR